MKNSLAIIRTKLFNEHNCGVISDTVNWIVYVCFLDKNKVVLWQALLFFQNLKEMSSLPLL